MATDVVHARPGPHRHLHGQGRRRDGRASRATLGLPGVTARTFHAHALSQLRHFWPLHARRRAAARPARLEAVAPRAARPGTAGPLPVHPGQGPGRRDRVGQEPAPDADDVCRGRGRDPDRARRANRRSRSTCSSGVFAGYERAKTRAGRMDFDDLLAGTIDVLETDADAAATVHARKRWFSVDEYQDTNPMQQRLLELWLGDRRDLCVVGDEDQTIYTFTGATSDFLTGFADRHPDARVIELAENYRSSPQVLALANNLLASTGREKRLVATRAGGSGAGRRAPRDRGGRTHRARAVGPRTDRRRHGAGRDRGPRPDQRPARPDRGGLHAGRDRVPGPRRPLLRPGGRPRGDRPRPSGRIQLDRAGPRRRHPGAVGGQARLRRRHRGRARRRGGTRTDRGPRHAARHPRDPGPLRRARRCRRRTSPSSTGAARPSARVRPTGSTC